jgi:hypothetical protein
MENQIDLCKDEAELVLNLLREEELDPKFIQPHERARNHQVIALIVRIEKAFPELAS